jgi:hypothetical protein
MQSKTLLLIVTYIIFFWLKLINDTHLSLFDTSIKKKKDKNKTI